MRRLVPILILVTAFANCDPQENADATLGAIKKAKTAAGKASARVNTSEANEIGIAECDEYLRNYESCLAEKVPEEQRESLRIGVNAERIRWQDQVTSGHDREKIVSDCKSSADSARLTLSSFGCSF